MKPNERNRIEIKTEKIDMHESPESQSTNCPTVKTEIKTEAEEHLIQNCIKREIDDDEIQIANFDPLGDVSQTKQERELFINTSVSANFNNWDGNEQIGVKVDISTGNSSFEIDIDTSTLNCRQQEGSQHNTQNNSNSLNPHNYGIMIPYNLYEQTRSFHLDRPASRTLITVKLNDNLFNNCSSGNGAITPISSSEISSEKSGPTDKECQIEEGSSTSVSESSDDSDDELPNRSQGTRSKNLNVSLLNSNSISDVVKKILFSENNSSDEQLGQKLLDLLNDDHSDGESSKETQDNTEGTTIITSKTCSSEEQRTQVNTSVKRVKNIVSEKQTVSKVSHERNKQYSKTENSTSDGTSKDNSGTSSYKTKENSNLKKTVRRVNKISDADKQTPSRNFHEQNLALNKNIESSEPIETSHSSSKETPLSENHNIKISSKERESSKSTISPQDRLIQYLNKNVENLISKNPNLSTSDKETSESTDTDEENNVDKTTTTKNNSNKTKRTSTNIKRTTTKTPTQEKKKNNADSGNKLSVSCRTNVSYRSTTGHKRSTSENHFPPKKKVQVETQHSTTVASETPPNFAQTTTQTENSQTSVMVSEACHTVETQHRTTVVSEIHPNLVQTSRNPESSVMVSEQEMNQACHTVNDFLNGMMNPYTEASTLPTFLGQVYIRGYETGLQERLSGQGSKRGGRGRSRKTI